MTTPAQDAPLVLPAVAFRPVRLLVICVALAAVAAVAAALLGVPMVGLFFAIGLALGLTNAIMIQRSVESITAKDHPLKRNMAMNSAARLLIMTVIGLTIAYVFKPQGLGVVFGMALFQVILVASTTLPVVKKLKAQAADADATSTGGTGLEGETPQQ